MRLYHTRRYTVEATQVTEEILLDQELRSKHGIFRVRLGQHLDVAGEPEVFVDDYLVKVGDEDVFVLSPDQFHALFSETAS